MNFWPSFGKAKPQVEPDDTDEEIGVPKTVEESPAKDNAPTLASAKTEDTTDSEESNKEGAPKKEEDEPVLDAEEPEQVLEDVKAYLRGKSLVDLRGKSLAYHVALFHKMEGNWEAQLQIYQSANKFSDQDKDNLRGDQEWARPLRLLLDFPLGKVVAWLVARLNGATLDAAELFPVLMEMMSSADELPDENQARLFEDNRIVLDHGNDPAKATLEVIAKLPEYMQVFCLTATKSMLTNASCKGIRDILAAGKEHGAQSKPTGKVRDTAVEKAKKGKFPMPHDLRSIDDTYLEERSVHGSKLLKKPEKIPVISAEDTHLLANCIACAYRLAAMQAFGKPEDVLTDAKYHPNLKELQGSAVADKTRHSIKFLQNNCHLNASKLDYLLQHNIDEFFNAKPAAKPPAVEEPSGKAKYLANMVKSLAMKFRAVNNDPTILEQDKVPQLKAIQKEMMDLPDEAYEDVGVVVGKVKTKPTAKEQFTNMLNHLARPEHKKNKMYASVLEDPLKRIVRVRPTPTSKKGRVVEKEHSAQAKILEDAGSPYELPSVNTIAIMMELGPTGDLEHSPSGALFSFTNKAWKLGMVKMSIFNEMHGRYPNSLEVTNQGNYKLFDNRLEYLNVKEMQYLVPSNANSFSWEPPVETVEEEELQAEEEMAMVPRAPGERFGFAGNDSSRSGVFPSNGQLGVAADESSRTRTLAFPSQHMDMKALREHDLAKERIRGEANASMAVQVIEAMAANGMGLEGATLFGNATVNHNGDGGNNAGMVAAAGALGEVRGMVAEMHKDLKKSAAENKEGFQQNKEGFQQMNQEFARSVKKSRPPASARKFRRSPSKKNPIRPLSQRLGRMFSPGKKGGEGHVLFASPKGPSVAVSDPEEGSLDEDSQGTPRPDHEKKRCQALNKDGLRCTNTFNPRDASDSRHPDYCYIKSHQKQAPPQN